MARLVEVEEAPDKNAKRVRLKEVPVEQQPRSVWENIAGGTGRGIVGSAGMLFDLATSVPQTNPDLMRDAELFGGEPIPRNPNFTGPLIDAAGRAGIPVEYDQDSYPGKAADFISSGLLFGGLGRARRAGKAVEAGQSAVRAYGSQLGREGVQGAAAAGSSMVVGEAVKDVENPYLRGAANLAAPMLPNLGLLGLTGAVRGTARGLGDQKRQAFVTNADEFKAVTGAEPTVSQAANNTRMVALERAASFTGTGNFPLWEAGKKQAEGMKGTIADIMGGGNMSKTAAGNALEEGLFGPNGYVQRGAAKGDVLYGNMFAKFDQTARMPLSKSGKLLEDFTNRYSVDPEFEPILRDTLFANLNKAVAENAARTGVGPTVGTVRAIRSDIGALLGKNRSSIPGDQATGDLKRLYAMLSEDIGAAAKNNGDEAYRAFKEADTHWKNYRAITDDVLSKIEGKSGKDLFLAIERKDDKSLVKILDSLDPDERKLVAQTVINNLGKVAPSAQKPVATVMEQIGAGPAADVFSPHTFLTKWNGLTPTTRTILVPDAKTRASLDKFADVLSNTSEGAKVIFNTSGTTGSGMLGAQMIALVGSLATGNIPLAAKVGGSIAGSYWLARKITDPKTVQWLAQANTIPPVAIPGHIARLGRIDYGSEEENAMRDQAVAELTQYFNGPGTGRQAPQ